MKRKFYGRGKSYEDKKSGEKRRQKRDGRRGRGSLISRLSWFLFSFLLQKRLIASYSWASRPVSAAYLYSHIQMDNTESPTSVLQKEYKSNKRQQQSEPAKRLLSLFALLLLLTSRAKATSFLFYRLPRSMADIVVPWPKIRTVHYTVYLQQSLLMLYRVDPRSTEIKTNKPEPYSHARVK